MKKLLMTLLLLLAVAGSGPALAEENKADQAPAKNEVLEAAHAMMEGLDERSKRHFTVMYGNYNLIKVVETVEESVATAVKACGAAHEEMKAPLDTRFDAWKGAVKPVIEEAHANVDNMVLAQEYVKPREIKKFFKMIDKARKQQDQEVEKVPVTSQEGCQALLDNMDDTQPEMIHLLKTTLVSLPLLMQQQDEEQMKKEAEISGEDPSAGEER